MKTFIKDTADLAQYLKTNISLSFELVQPDIFYVEQNIMRPLVHAPYFDSLLEREASELNEHQSLLIEYIKTATANLAFYEYIPKGNVQMSSAGVKQKHSDTEKPAFQWAVKEFRNAFQERGFQQIDMMLNYLEENYKHHTRWAASATYKAHKNTLISTAKDFSNYIDINNSARLFYRLHATIKRIEDTTINGLLGSSYFAELKEKVAQGNPAKHEKELLEALKAAVAHLAIANSVRLLSVTLSANGFFTIDSNATETIEGKKSLSDGDQRGMLEHEYKSTADIYLQKALDLLQENPKYLYKTWYEWKQTKKENRNPRFDNGEAKGIFVL